MHQLYKSLLRALHLGGGISFPSWLHYTTSLSTRLLSPTHSHLTPLHLLLSDLSHTLCITHRLPSYTRTIWLQFLIEHPSSTVTWLDVHDHNLAPFSRMISDLEEHRLFTNAKTGQKMVGSGPWHMLACSHGESTLTKGIRKHAEVIDSDERYRRMWECCAVWDWREKVWGMRPVAMVWRESTLEVLRGLKRKEGKEDKARKRKEKGENGKQGNGM